MRQPASTASALIHRRRYSPASSASDSGARVWLHRQQLAAHGRGGRGATRSLGACRQRGRRICGRGATGGADVVSWRGHTRGGVAAPVGACRRKGDPVVVPTHSRVSRVSTTGRGRVLASLYDEQKPYDGVWHGWPAPWHATMGGGSVVCRQEVGGGEGGRPPSTQGKRGEPRDRAEEGFGVACGSDHVDIGVGGSGAGGGRRCGRRPCR